jgi:hypothetical protein
MRRKRIIQPAKSAGPLNPEDFLQVDYSYSVFQILLVMFLKSHRLLSASRFFKENINSLKLKKYSGTGQ